MHWNLVGSSVGMKKMKATVFLTHEHISSPYFFPLWLEELWLSESLFHSWLIVDRPIITLQSSYHDPSGFVGRKKAWTNV